MLDWPHSNVPITSGGELEMVVDRTALAEQLARLFVEDLGGLRRRRPGAAPAPAENG